MKLSVTFHIWFLFNKWSHFQYTFLLFALRSSHIPIVWRKKNDFFSIEILLQFYCSFYYSKSLLAMLSSLSINIYFHRLHWNFYIDWTEEIVCFFSLQKIKIIVQTILVCSTFASGNIWKHAKYLTNKLEYPNQCGIIFI